MLTGGKSVDVATALLTAGLAKLHGSFRAAEQPGGPELEALEQKARDARLKVLHTIPSLLDICSYMRCSLATNPTLWKGLPSTAHTTIRNRNPTTSAPVSCPVSAP